VYEVVKLLQRAVPDASPLEGQIFMVRVVSHVMRVLQLIL
jgi:hypothetical protein